MKRLLLFAIIFLSIKSHAQPYELGPHLSNIVKEYLAFNDFVKRSANKDLTSTEVSGMSDYYKRAEPDMNWVEKNGDPPNVKTAFYIRISMLIDIGAWYTMKEMNQSAYEYLASAQPGMEYFFDARLFPIIFKEGDHAYTMAWEDFRVAYPPVLQKPGGCLYSSVKTRRSKRVVL